MEAVGRSLRTPRPDGGHRTGEEVVTGTGTAPQKRDRILAIDVGTTAVKAAVLDGSAVVLSTGTAAQRTLSDDSGRREHVPAETWRAVARAVRRAVDGADGADGIRAISVTGPRGTFAVVGPD